MKGVLAFVILAIFATKYSEGALKSCYFCDPCPEEFDPTNVEKVFCSELDYDESTNSRSMASDDSNSTGKIPQNKYLIQAYSKERSASETSRTLGTQFEDFGCLTLDIEFYNKTKQTLRTCSPITSTVGKNNICEYISEEVKGNNDISINDCEECYSENCNGGAMTLSFSISLLLISLVTLLIQQQ